MRIFELNTKKGKCFISSDEIEAFSPCTDGKGNALIHHPSQNITVVEETVEDLIVLFDKPVYSILEGMVITTKAKAFVLSPEDPEAEN